MYEFVDRPVLSLNRSGRLLVWAMRHWVKAASMGRCPCGDVAPAFQKHGLMPSFPHFHVMMAVFNREAVERLRFGSVECERVSEHEALILSFVRTVRGATAAQMRETLNMVVAPHAVGTLLIALSALAHDMAEAGLMPAAEIHDSQCRFPDE
jgi:hypothetical protein